MMVCVWLVEVCLVLPSPALCTLQSDVPMLRRPTTATLTTPITSHRFGPAFFKRRRAGQQHPCEECQHHRRCLLPPPPPPPPGGAQQCQRQRHWARGGRPARTRTARSLPRLSGCGQLQPLALPTVLKTAGVAKKAGRGRSVHRAALLLSPGADRE